MVPDEGPAAPVRVLARRDFTLMVYEAMAIPLFEYVSITPDRVLRMARYLGEVYGVMQEQLRGNRLPIP